MRRSPITIPLLRSSPGPKARLRRAFFRAKNHPNRESSQPMPATRLANAPQNLFRLLSPFEPSKPCAFFQPRKGRRTVATGAARRSEASRAQPVVTVAKDLPPRQGWRSHSNARKKPPHSRNIATHARHKCWHSPQKVCVTLCHFKSDSFTRPIRAADGLAANRLTRPEKTSARRPACRTAGTTGPCPVFPQTVPRFRRIPRR